MNGRQQARERSSRSGFLARQQAKDVPSKTDASGRVSKQEGDGAKNSECIKASKPIKQKSK